MNLEGSVLVANPVLKEMEVPFDKMEAFIQQALKAADAQGVNGKQVTPFILKYIANLTGGESLDANIALVKNNAKLGAQIAVAL